MLSIAYKSLLRLPKFRGRHRVESVFRRLLEPGYSRLSNGLKMRLDPQEYTQIAILSNEPPEPLTVLRIDSLLKPGDTFIDVGAHVGFLSLLAAKRVGESGVVWAIDPQPYNAERILENALLNDFNQIIVILAAVSESDGLIRVAQQTSSDKARLTLSGSGVNDTNVCYFVSCYKLDTLIDNLGISGRIKLVKIDVEGHELEVFKGAVLSLERIDNFIFEVLPSADLGVQDEIAQFLKEKGFCLRTIDGGLWAPGETALENNIWATRGE